MLTNNELDAIELRALQATPPPWTAPAYRPTPEGAASYNVVVSEHANICGLHDGGQTRERIDANAQFIAHAPEDVRALVGELRAERARTETLREALKDLAVAFSPKIIPLDVVDGGYEESTTRWGGNPVYERALSALAASVEETGTTPVGTTTENELWRYTTAGEPRKKSAGEETP